MVSNMKSYGLSQLSHGLSDGLLCSREEVHKALLGPQSSSHVYKEGFYGGVVEGVKAKKFMFNLDSFPL